jgi:hypothetical protein
MSGWARALAAYRRAEAQVEAFRAEEALPPAAEREAAEEGLEERFGVRDSRRRAALRRLLRIPAPDLPALSLKLDLAVAAWEITGCEIGLAAIAADLRRLSGEAV